MKKYIFLLALTSIPFTNASAMDLSSSIRPHLSTAKLGVIAACGLYGIPMLSTLCHESGHALAGKFLWNSSPVIYMGEVNSNKIDAYLRQNPSLSQRKLIFVGTWQSFLMNPLKWKTGLASHENPKNYTISSDILVTLAGP